MFFIIATVLSAAILCLALILAVRIARLPYRSSRFITPSRTLAVGVFISGWLLYFPHYFMEFGYQNLFARIWEAFWVSAHHTIRLFVIDTGFEEIFYSATNNGGNEAYAILGTILFIFAPIMTAGVILSFFKNFVAYLKCLAKRKEDAYIFSELNEKSLALATDISQNHKDAAIIFCDVFGEDNEENYDLCESARELGAVCFRKDIASLNLAFFTKASALHFFAIGEKEAENVKHAYAIVDPEGAYGKRENVFLYVFSTDVQSELLLNNLPESRVRFRRIDDIRSLVLRTLYDSGEKLFEKTVTSDDGQKCINAVVVGTGGHGKEMIKALTWFCQMEGFRIEIHAFDIDPLAKERFALQAPELMSEKNNGVYIRGEAQYKITFHAGISVDDTRFTDELATIGTPTYVFISMGEDARNVRTAVLMRRYFRQKHLADPAIQAIVYDTKNKEILNRAHNWKGQKYGIEFIGDLAEMYSERVILRQDLEDEALITHKGYGGTEDDFYRYEYNYRSSMASALHRHLRRKLDIANFEKTAAELTVEERDLLERIEHNRWNAYMRAEGYVYSGSKGSESRDDLAWMHHNLIPFDELSEDDKRKDSIVGASK